ncbi:hypothetical protein [Actimicrobium sp. CCI2.3]|uniref:hypothetical protein n=1 Tax=Actimicrobium sp. CCI2.3 TaxID=3048616 RepID=UPI002AB44D21|nr:hypothetical protein [Actimicrobium sp. CCI2.3]MDY7573115.1 hypothetical protein [Actimicrobium sp. CCI2.3]MEB0021148.1 hypothetical protein [Actimicrobium sp. CCI2.3]
MTDSAIYQRTDAGRIEIQLKKEGLTQSERLVLIVVDGRAPLSELDDKFKGLESSRIRRAIEKLVVKQLIFEVLMPGTSVKNEVVDAVLIDRFLEQDPLDPVTVVSFDADYEYVEGQLANNLDQQDFPIPFLAGSSIMREKGVLYPILSSQRPDVFVQSVELVDFYIPLFKSSPAETGGSVSPRSTGFGLSAAVRSVFHLRDRWRPSDRGQVILMLWLLLFSFGLVIVSLSIWDKISLYLGFT